MCRAPPRSWGFGVAHCSVRGGSLPSSPSTPHHLLLWSLQEAGTSLSFPTCAMVLLSKVSCLMFPVDSRCPSLGPLPASPLFLLCDALVYFPLWT